MVVCCGLLCWAGRTETTGLAGTPYLVVVDRQTYADATLREKLELYFRHVNTLFSCAPSVVVVDPFDPAAPGKDISVVRELIKQQYLQHQIAGVILLGKVPYMIWRQAAGGTWVNYGTEDFYYADLDADFQDRETRYGNGNSDIRNPSSTNNCNNRLVAGREDRPDGQYDTYLRGTNEGPEVWVSRIYASTNTQYYGFFDKANDYYREVIRQLAADTQAVVSPYKNILYTGHPSFAPHKNSDKYRFLNEFNSSMAGSQFVVFGENGGGTVTELFTNYASRAYLFAEVDGHADPFNHDLKGGRYTAKDVLQKLGPGQGALIQALWGCHSGDFWGIKEGRVNLTLAYILSQGVSQAAYGCSWTSGTEETEKDILKNMGQGDYLGLAFQKMQKRLYSREYMETFFANEARHLNHFLPANAPEPERRAELMNRLLRGYNLIGNPFLKISYTHTPKQR